MPVMVRGMLEASLGSRPQPPSFVTLGLIALVLTALAVGAMRWPLPAVVLGLGVVAVGLAWWRSLP